MTGIGRLCLPALVLLWLAGCSSALQWVPDTYVVQPGDTLYSIAWRYHMDHRSLARWNGLGDGSLIRPGQRIRLVPPNGSVAAARPAPAAGRSRAAAPRTSPAVVSPPRRWYWPGSEKVVAAFGSSQQTESGIQLGGRRGQPVRAAADGVVVYAGSGLIGYGQLLIIKHNATYLSAYGHNDVLLVKEGDRVRGGQKVARMGLGPGNRPLLHFEIRKNGEPVDPLRYLPPRK